MNSKGKPDILVVTGPTATGKTKLAAELAQKLNGEIISADSRQVYRGMDLATGKDLNDYVVGDQTIPYHLVDIVDPGYEYNVFEFQKDFLKTFNNIQSRKKYPILCGGTGMYIEAVLKGYKLVKVPVNKKLRVELESKSDDELAAILNEFKVPHNTTDTSDKKRLLRAIEIQTYYHDHPEIKSSFPQLSNIVVGVFFERKEIRERITNRLKERLQKGMADEVKDLLRKGLTADQLKFYGLEYRYLTQYITGELDYDEMFKKLNTAIHQFAKRQMTWFRRMEKQGIHIHWIDGTLPEDQKVQSVLKLLKA